MNPRTAKKSNLIFFTKGKPTQKIWYYDLNHLKVRKKAPLLLKHFDDFHQALPLRADTELSWTMNFAARKAATMAEAKPLRTQATQKDEEAQAVKAQLAELKKAHPRDDEAVRAAQENFAVLTKEVRELNHKAQEIEDATYDLKAVNPNKKAIVDERTPLQLIEVIEAKGREIAEALAVLKQP